jgi:transcription elongation factor Elf1
VRYPAACAPRIRNLELLPPTQRWRGTAVANLSFVQNQTAARSRPEKAAVDPDIFFNCEHCKAALVVNKSAAGMKLSCQKCGQLTLVPQPAAAATADGAQSDEIRRKLKENESQRLEVTGYINQLGIQLNRWQLRLQMLAERKTQLETELAGLGK